MIPKVKLIQQLPRDLYDKLWQLNEEFAIRESALHRRKIDPVPVEKYESVVVIDPCEDLVIYTNNLQSTMLHRLRNAYDSYNGPLDYNPAAMRIAYCIIAFGKVIKNRYGDND